jgi:DNA invertase Pin-like site-specific DNA recombinase
VRRRAAAGTGKRGRRSKFTDDEVKVFRKRVESGKVTVSGLAKKLKVSVPTAYNYLRRAGWKAK